MYQFKCCHLIDGTNQKAAIDPSLAQLYFVSIQIRQPVPFLVNKVEKICQSVDRSCKMDTISYNKYSKTGTLFGVWKSGS
jgi:hypothetical protein